MSPGWRDRLLVEQRKVVAYLLSAAHPTGRHKAEFFGRLGFLPGEPTVLQEALLAHGRSGEIRENTRTEFGRKYIVEGSLKTPAGGRPLVRSVWFETEAQGPVRLVTAYPIGGHQ